MAAPHLPLEIWRIVCEKLTADNFCAIGSEFDREMIDDWECDYYEARKSLSVLCGVSRGIAEVAQAALFKCYYMDEKGDRGTHLKFLRAILDSPDRLATYVREVRLENFVYSETREERLGVDPNLYLFGIPNDFPGYWAEETASMYARLAARLGFDTADIPFNPDDLVRREAQARGVPAVIVLSLPLLPNLEVLRIMLGFEKHGFKLLQQLRAIGVRVRGLIDGELDWSAIGNGFFLTRFAPLLALTPNVATLRLDWCGGFDPEEPDTDPVQTMRECMPPGVKALELRRSRLDDRDMGIVLNCCHPGLERFRYQSGCPEKASVEVTPRQLVRHLLRFKATLKEVEFDYSLPSRGRFDANDSRDEYETRLTKEAHFAEFLALESFVHLTKEDYVESDDD
ncbi:hypothetical protein PG995_013119 [Apiospora arundinis]